MSIKTFAITTFHTLAHCEHVGLKNGSFSLCSSYAHVIVEQKEAGYLGIKPM